MRYKALALDLDGTLVNSKKELSQGNKKAIWRAIDSGLAVILATGRPTLGVMPLAKELELDKRGGFILNYNGGRIAECRSGKIIVEHVLPPECIQAIGECAKKAGVYACTYTKNQIVAESDTDEYVLKEAFCNGTTVKKVDDFVKFVDYSVNKCLVVGEHEKLLPVQAQLKKTFPDKLEAFFSESYFLEVVPPNVSKSEGLKQIAKALNINLEEMAACGDGLNDIPMLETAGLGIAMANAYDEVKAVADMLAPSNDDDGVAWVIENVIMKD